MNCRRSCRSRRGGGGGARSVKFLKVRSDLGPRPRLSPWASTHKPSKKINCNTKKVNLKLVLFRRLLRAAFNHLESAHVHLVFLLNITLPWRILCICFPWWRQRIVSRKYKTMLLSNSVCMYTYNSKFFVVWLSRDSSLVSWFTVYSSKH